MFYSAASSRTVALSFPVRFQCPGRGFLLGELLPPSATSPPGQEDSGFFSRGYRSKV